MVSKIKPKWSKYAIWGFVLSFFGPLAIIGLGLSIYGIIDSNKNNKKGKGLAIAGVVIASIIFLGFVFFPNSDTSYNSQNTGNTNSQNLESSQSKNHLENNQESIAENNNKLEQTTNTTNELSSQEETDAISSESLEICNLIKEDFYGIYDQHIRAKSKCLAELSIKYDNSEGCNEISNEYSDKAKQYLGICNAGVENKASKCENTGWSQGYCLAKSVEFGAEVSLCDSVNDEQIYTDWCNALKNEDQTLCSNSKSNIGTECYISIAKKTKNPEICLEIQRIGYGDRENCIMQVAIRKNDKGIINEYLDKLSVPEGQDEEFFKEKISDWKIAFNKWFEAVQEKNTNKCKEMSKLTPLTSDGQAELAMQCYGDIASN